MTTKFAVSLAALALGTALTLGTALAAGRSQNDGGQPSTVGAQPAQSGGSGPTGDMSGQSGDMSGQSAGMGRSGAMYDTTPGGAGLGQSAVGDCEAQFRSYDPASETYLGFDGMRHQCP